MTRPKPAAGKPRCKNCGDRTHFDENAAGPREKLGWCRPCWLTAMKNTPHGGHADMGFVAGEQRDPERGIYKSGPYDGRLQRRGSDE